MTSIEAHRKGNIPFGILQHMMKSWIIRFEEEYLLQQTYFEPYPKELVDIEEYIARYDEKDYMNDSKYQIINRIRFKLIPSIR